jgi:hypothetical protein
MIDENGRQLIIVQSFGSIIYRSFDYLSEKIDSKNHHSDHSTINVFEKSSMEKSINYVKMKHNNNVLEDKS